jgi:hypothetical protein
VVGGKEARNFIEAIYPHLSPRRQAQIESKFMTWAKYNVRRPVLLRERRERALNSRLIQKGRLRLAT